eukprot:3832445-Pyramimonas_sp.AAC.1
MPPPRRELDLGADKDLTVHMDDITTSVAMPAAAACLNSLASLAGLEVPVALEKILFTTNSHEVAALAPAALGPCGHTIAGH